MILVVVEVEGCAVLGNNPTGGAMMFMVEK
jgi:hypothetical protein